jgi:hypothetical protein
MLLDIVNIVIFVYYFMLINVFLGYSTLEDDQIFRLSSTPRASISLTTEMGNEHPLKVVVCEVSDTPLTHARETTPYLVYW